MIEQNSTPTSDTSAPFDVAYVKRQLLQLKDLHTSGALSSESYEEGRNKLERRILDWVMRDGADDTAMASTTVATMGGLTVAPASALVDAPIPASAVKAPMRLMAILAVAVVVIAAAGYAWMRNSGSGIADGSGGAQNSAGSGDAAGPGKPHATNFDQIAEMTDKLSTKLKDNPEDSEGWAMLARSFSVLGRNPEALTAYEKAVALRANDAVLLADYADALALKNNRSLAGEPMKVVERALKIEPRNLKALSLAGTHSFEKKDYAGAVKFWEQVVEFGPANNRLVEQVLPGLTEARELAGLPPISRILGSGTSPDAAKGQTVSGTVTLSATLVGNAKPQDAVYIYARAVEGSRMPLALLQKKVKDLPMQYVLDDSMAMSPESTLSKVGKITVNARISKSGNAMPEAGDLIGQSAVVTVGAKEVAVEIKETVK
jgi:cytochrome c-type biogenesis protein CcmH